VELFQNKNKARNSNSRKLEHHDIFFFVASFSLELGFVVETLESSLRHETASDRKHEKNDRDDDHVKRKTKLFIYATVTLRVARPIIRATKMKSKYHILESYVPPYSGKTQVPF
jgi:hypothetical protein